MRDKDREVLPPMNGDVDLPERLWLYDDFAPDEDPPVTDYASGLASLGFIGAALRRRVRTWCGMGLIGLLCGLAYFVASPPAYQATTTVLLTHSIDENPIDAMSTDLALAHSDTVASHAMQQLGLHEPISSFLAVITADNLTDRVLQITARAKSPAAATQRAKAVAAAFLQVRASELQKQQQLTVAALQQQVVQDRQHVASLSAQLSGLSGTNGPADKARRSQLQSQLTDAQAALQVLQTNNEGVAASSASSVAAQIKGSQVLDPALAGHHSAAKFALIYALMGLVVGLALGLAVVIIGALVSGRLRRRDDIADALGTSVNLSVGPIRGRGGWLPATRARAAQRTGIQRIVAHLRDAIPDRESGGEAPALGVVPVDNDKAAAQALVATALACAKDGQNVLVADLCAGAPAAHLLKAAKPGVQTVTVDGARLAVAVPSKDDMLPTGPVRRFRPEPAGRAPASTPAVTAPASGAPAGEASAGAARAGGTPDGGTPDGGTPDGGTPDGGNPDGGAPEDALTAAYRSADVLLTLASLDPALGGEHLRSWAGDTVVVVSAGRSSWMRIHAVGEMIRLARLPLVSAILLQADRTDESMGLTQAAVRGTRVARANGL